MTALKPTPPGPPRYANNESGVIRMVREQLEHGLFARIHELPPILRWEHEFGLPRGRRADFLLFHEDGSLTVIECKGPGSAREVLAGLGQLLLYRLQISLSGSTGYVRGLLMAPLPVDDGTEDNVYVALACEVAGVTFCPTPSIAALNQATGVMT